MTRFIENILKQEYWEKESKRMLSLYKDNKDELLELCKTFQNKTIRKEFARGGQVVHRGYYLPSPIQDIVIDNVNRGSLYKRLPKAGEKISYEYCYDENDCLFFVVAEPHGIKTYEWIQQQKDKIVGLEFNPYIDYVYDINECTFENGVPTSYTFALLSVDKEILSIRKETYTYGSNGLEIAYINEYSPKNSFSRKGYLLTGQIFKFEHDNEGYLSKYTVCEMDKLDYVSVFDIKIKRKL